MDLLEIFLHLDQHLAALIAEYPRGVYLVVAIIFFVETALVVTPMVPGESVLFACGALAAAVSLDLFTLIATLTLSAMAGDTVNYHIGGMLGRRAGRREQEGRFIRQRHLDRSRAFYEKHGSRTVMLARFVPVMRSVAPFMAGISGMTYRRFALFNALGGFLWVTLITLIGYFLGQLPFVKQQFGLVVLSVALIASIPTVVEWRLDARRRRAE